MWVNVEVLQLHGVGGGGGGVVVVVDVVVVQVLIGMGTVSVAPASRMIVEAQQDGWGGLGGMKGEVVAVAAA